MSIETLMRKMETRKALSEGWDIIRLEILINTLRRLTTPETVEAELQKTLADFLAMQEETNDLSKYVTNEIGENVVKEIKENIINQGKVKAAAFTL